ncbi:ATP synthase F1 subunit epsilon [Patescibacteria group bacterium]|nr:ATP synthase F1 subunit epsilon [Patescibacteria group bacterium]
MEKEVLNITIISQERQLDTVQADQITAPTTEGEITVLPGHIPLFSRLQAGELRYKSGSEETSFAISKGFIDVGPDNQVTVLVDSAVAAREISMEKAEAAMRAAQETMAQSQDQRELMMAEASLKAALLEIKIAQKTRQASRM